MSDKNPIDEHFKQHLQDAEVKPSSDLWSKMEPRLNNERSNRKGWWIGIAASIAFAAAVSSWMYDTYQDPDVLPGDTIGTEQPETETPTTPPSKEINGLELRNLHDPQEDRTETIANEEEDKGSRTEAPRTRSNTVDARRTIADGEERPEQDERLATNTEGSNTRSSTPEPQEVGVKVRINPRRYLAMAEPEEEQKPNTTAPKTQESAPERVEITEYAESQFNNLISGESLEAPKKDQIKWPALSLNLSPILQKFNPDNDNPSTEH